MLTDTINTLRYGMMEQDDEQLVNDEQCKWIKLNGTISEGDEH